MRRLFWLAAGATIGVLVVRKLSRAAQRLTPQSLAADLGAGLSDLAASVREFAADVRAAASDREAQLRADTGLDGSDTTMDTTVDTP
jgi:hypothetical protein